MDRDGIQEQRGYFCPDQHHPASLIVRSHRWMLSDPGIIIRPSGLNHIIIVGGYDTAATQAAGLADLLRSNGS